MGRVLLAGREEMKVEQIGVLVVGREEIQVGGEEVQVEQMGLLALRFQVLEGSEGVLGAWLEMFVETFRTPCDFFFVVGSEVFPGLSVV